MSERRLLVGGNWKMHKTAAEARAFCGALVDGIGESRVDIVLFPAHPLLPAVARAVEGSPVAVGGQDLHPEDEGAHTGDVSGGQLADAGCTWTLCGHSERRRDHGESDALVARKALAARRHGLLPLVCVGESLAERRSGATLAVLERQLGAVLAAGLDRFELAYEPVWAIGTGETATPEQAQEAHAFLRAALGGSLGERQSEEIRILYGGSVKPGNAEELIAQPDVDGFLVGGASLESAGFLAIIQACGRRPRP